MALSNLRNRCPWCGEECEISQTNEQEVYYDEVRIEYECEKCQAVWDRVYYYERTELTKRGKDL